MAIRAVGFDLLGVLWPIHAEASVPGADAQLDPHLLGLARQLRAAGYRTGILSNLAGTAAAQLQTAHLETIFDAVIFSGEAGVAKPDPAAFQLLAARLGVTPPELAFIDDRPFNLIHAPELGLTPIVYRRYRQLLSQLQALGLKLS